ncbi:MAG TPA: flagellar export chaperone FlgN [Syntrophorhabdaceae bacterium]|jgi:flagellar biosynthesis/type III secretory pathway chaperone
MKEELVFEITHKELGLLREFSTVLRGEHDAIISFSLEGIVAENNHKEEILKKLEYLKREKDTLLTGDIDPETTVGGKTWRSLCTEMNHTIKDVRNGIDRNMKLLSFSVDHVKSSIENIVGLLNRTSYGKKKERISMVLSRSV